LGDAVQTVGRCQELEARSRRWSLRSDLENVEDELSLHTREVNDLIEVVRDIRALANWGLAAGAHPSDLLPHVDTGTYDIVQERALERSTAPEPAQYDMFLAACAARVVAAEKQADAAEAAKVVARFEKLELL